MDGCIDFYRNWYNYSIGFGEVNEEHWLGNDKLVEILSAYSSNELRVDMRAVNGETAYAKYKNFDVGCASTQYRLTVNGYSGTSGI